MNEIIRFHDSPAVAIVRVLRGSWRQNPEPLTISAEELSSIAPLLLQTGAGALAWRRVQSLELAGEKSFLDLKNAYRCQSIEAAIHQFNVRDAFKRARQTAVEPILLKGWALAHRYPDDALRPYGDIDLWLRPSDLHRLQQALPVFGEHTYCVET
ncbi:MAG TPA: nucleotidyltransferase family protein, partial [Pyrinomonadaceae bacterium]|nr:nucleotidyltransferase family protein [Pyrinomonadaceae bacterium]